jgi:hypothetical protein
MVQQADAVDPPVALRFVQFGILGQAHPHRVRVAGVHAPKQEFPQYGLRTGGVDQFIRAAVQQFPDHEIILGRDIVSLKRLPTQNNDAINQCLIAVLQRDIQYARPRVKPRTV